MTNDWRAMNDNQLRAHLEGALLEREAHDVPQDCGYTEEEFLAIAGETVRRRLQAVEGLNVGAGLTFAASDLSVLALKQRA